MNNSDDQEFDYWWEALANIDSRKNRIAELEAAKADTVEDVINRDNRIAQIRKEIAQLEAGPEAKLTRPGRKHVLDQIIAQATQAVGCQDIDAVWRELCREAQLSAPPKPIVGFADRAIQYRDIAAEDPDELLYYKRKNLSDKLGRKRREISAK